MSKTRLPKLPRAHVIRRARTSSWVATPEDACALGGAIFCDRRDGKVFVCHNRAELYDAPRGFRGLLRVYRLHSSREDMKAPCKLETE